MARPDPRLVSRQPMVTALGRAGEIAHSVSRVGATPGPLRLVDAAGRLDVDAVWRLFDAASVIVEGRIYEAAAVAGGPPGRPVFLGTALATVDLAPLALAEDEPGARRVRDVLARDRRTLVVLRERALRETARLLGPETPTGLEATLTLRVRGTTLLADLDLEGVVETPDA